MAGRRSKAGMWLGPDERPWLVRRSVRDEAQSASRRDPIGPSAKRSRNRTDSKGGPRFQQGAGSLALFL